MVVCRSSRAPPSSRRSGTSQSPSARSTSRPARSSSGSSRPRTRSSRSPRSGAADGGVKRSPTTLIVHVSRDEPPLLEGAGPLSPETAERLVCDARRLTIKPQGRDLVHSRVGRCASFAQQRALHKRSGGHCQYPGCTAARELEGAPRHRRRAWRKDGARQPHPALPPPPQTDPRPPHPHERERRAPGVRGRRRTRDHRQSTTRPTALNGYDGVPMSACPLQSPSLCGIALPSALGRSARSKALEGGPGPRHLAGGDLRLRSSPESR